MSAHPAIRWPVVAGTRIAAVMLTIGEPSAARAAASVRTQTAGIEEIVVVEGITPFHRALNQGAAAVSAPLLLQVDADMVLDPGCAEVLRAAMAPGVAIAVGALRDPLLGRLAGVKLFRTRSLVANPMADTVSPDVHFYRLLAERGWQTRCVTGDQRRGVLTPTLGEHRPHYTPGYVFGTYSLLGSGYAQRGDRAALVWRFESLRASRHPLAPVARLALGHGVFVRVRRDAPKAAPNLAQARLLAMLAAQPSGAARAPEIASLLALPEDRRFEAFRSLGESLRTTSPTRLLACLQRLGEARHPGWLAAELGLGHGALSTRRAHPAASATSLARVTVASGDDPPTAGTGS